ncbi:helix-turn-helix transcriptional regulator [Bdellovibrionota bacterium FG-1]
MSQCKISIVLPRLLRERGFTQSQLSKNSGIPLSTLSTWLLPKSKPRDPEAVFKVANALGVTLEELLFDQRPVEREVTLEALPLEKLLDGLYRIRLERVIFNKNTENK